MLKDKLNKQTAALDLGTSSIKTLLVHKENEGELYISAVGQSESKGIRKGIIINIDAVVDNISLAVDRAEELAQHKITDVILGVSGSHLESMNSHGVVPVKYNEVSRMDIDHVLEAARAIPVPFDRDILGVLPQDYIVDSQSGIKDPLGIAAVRLESYVHVVTASANVLQNMIRCANRCGLRVQDLVMNAIASARGVTSDEERSQGVCVIDIGAGTADLCIYYDDKVRYSSVLPLGGSLLSKDLAAGLRIGVLSAENLKCRYGVACPQQISGEQRVEVQSLSSQVTKIVTQSEIANILKMRLNEMFGELKTEIQKSEFKDYLTAGIVLTGGTAKLNGITTLAEDVFHLPVRVGAPFGFGGLSDFITGPEYAAVAGLARNLISNESIYNNNSVDHNSKIKSGVRRIANWFNEHF